MANNFCSEHTSIVENQGKMLALLKVGNDTMDRLDKRINGALDRIAYHISEGDMYRDKIIALEVMAKGFAKNQEKKDKYMMWRTGIIIGVIMGVISIVSSWVMMIVNIGIK